MTDSPANDSPRTTIPCRRCQEDKPALAKAPFRNELGAEILATICQDCWKDWLEHQTLLINHYGLDVRDVKAREFLYDQVRKVLLEEGEGKEVDTSQQGSIEW